MSVTVMKAEGVTVYTVTFDPQSTCPPLCQIMKGLCYNPLCCSVSQQLRKVQGSSQSILGALVGSLNIVVGLLNICLGVILLSSHGCSWWSISDKAFPLWLGALFVLFGIIGIVSEKYPSPCLVIINVILNLAGVCFAITSLIIYSINIGVVWMRLEGKEVFLMLLTSINAVLIVLSALELCLVISSAIMGIKALRNRKKEEDKEMADPEHYKPLLVEVTSTPVA